MIKNILIFIIFASSPVFGGVDNNEVNIFIKFMHDKHSFDQEELRNLFDNVKIEPRIKKYIKKAPERTLTWNGCAIDDRKCTNYRNLFVNNKNIQNGIDFWKNMAQEQDPLRLLTHLSLSLWAKTKDEELNFIKLN